MNEWQNVEDGLIYVMMLRDERDALRAENERLRAGRAGQEELLTAACDKAESLRRENERLRQQHEYDMVTIECGSEANDRLRAALEAIADARRPLIGQLQNHARAALGRHNCHYDRQA